MLRRVITGLLTPIIMAVLLSTIAILTAGPPQPNTYTLSWFDGFIWYAMFGVPAYMVIGVPISVLLDNVWRKSTIPSSVTQRRIGPAVTYVLAATLVVVIFLLIPLGWAFQSVGMDGTTKLLMLGGFSGLLWYFISRCLHSFTLRRSKWR